MEKSQGVMTDKQSTHISFEDSMDISNAGDLHNRLRQSLESSRYITIDAGSVERADTAVLQLLCAFFKEAGQRGIEVNWQNPSESLAGSARLLGVHELLRLA